MGCLSGSGKHFRRVRGVGDPLSYYEPKLHYLSPYVTYVVYSHEDNKERVPLIQFGHFLAKHQAAEALTNEDFFAFPFRVYRIVNHIFG